jgi:hypothetical protein
MPPLELIGQLFGRRRDNARIRHTTHGMDEA